MNIFAFVIGLVVVVLTMVFAFLLVIINESKKPRNKVHFYVARNRINGQLNLYLNKPIRHKDGYWSAYGFEDFNGYKKWTWKSTRIVEDIYFDHLGLNMSDFKKIKWEDDPVEVFLNLEDLI